MLINFSTKENNFVGANHVLKETALDFVIEFMILVI